VSAIDPEELARIQRALDRIEERLHAAPDGFHAAGRPAAEEAIERSGLPADAAIVWRQFDGLELAMGEARLYALHQIHAATDAAEAEGLLRPGDRVIGERGRETWVLPEDPWAEGGAVVAVGDDIERGPEASTVAHLVLGVLGEIGVLYDDEGEFRDGLFDEDGELTPAVRRKLLRRRLDLDEDAPRARLQLVRALREAGELGAAQSEVKQLLRRAPEWSWALHEKGLLAAAQGRAGEAAKAHEQAAEHTDDEVLQADFLAHAAAVVGDEAKRAGLAGRVIALRPDYVQHQIEGARAHLDLGAVEEARRFVALALAIAPKNLAALELRRRIEEAKG
jgi:tetratricopeptide (TPR) repeat protein